MDSTLVMKNSYTCCQLFISNRNKAFNIYSQVNMKHIFFNCSSLISINLCNFNTNNVIDIIIIFQNLNKYCNTKIKDRKQLILKTENFLQNFAIDSSNIVIVEIGQLTFKNKNMDIQNVFNVNG